MSGMTPRQAECYAAIKRLSRDGASPSYTALAKAIGVASRANICRMVQGLKARGFVEDVPGKYRSLRALDPSLAPRFTPSDLRAMSTADLERLAETVEDILLERGGSPDCHAERMAEAGL